MAVMLTATEEGVADIYGFKLTLSSNWSFSPSYQYVVGACAGTVLYSLLQLCLGVYRLVTGSPITPSRFQAWLCFTSDQVPRLLFSIPFSSECNPFDLLCARSSFVI
jgi:hypothetical protein